MSRFYRHRQLEQDPDIHERWMVSYADFITLLFAFFVVMYALSMTHEGSFRVLSDSLEQAFNPQIEQGLSSNEVEPKSSDNLVDLGGTKGVLDGGSGVIEAIPELSDSMEKLQELASQQLMAPIEEEVQQTLFALIESGGVNITSEDLWMQIDIESGVLFESGRAKLQSTIIPTMQALASTLKKFHHHVQVEGYTDDVPIQNDVYPSNWELSAARAASVVHLFTQNGVDPERMSAVGYGEFRPIADNESAEGRAKNRRVVIVILADKQAGRLIDLQQQLKRVNPSK